MGFKSEAQRQKFLEMHKEGKISKEVLEAFESDSKKKLPERVEKKKKAVKNKAWFAKVTK